MYRSSSGFCFNADLNGEGNILRTCLNKNIVFDMGNLRYSEILNAANFYK